MYGMVKHASTEICSFVWKFYPYGMEQLTQLQGNNVNVKGYSIAIKWSNWSSILLQTFLF